MHALHELRWKLERFGANENRPKRPRKEWPGSFSALQRSKLPHIHIAFRVRLCVGGGVPHLERVPLQFALAKGPRWGRLWCPALIISNDDAHFRNVCVFRAEGSLAQRAVTTAVQAYEYCERLGRSGPAQQ